MRYLFHNIYGDAQSLLDTLPSDVEAIPFGWDEETETVRNNKIAELNNVVIGDSTIGYTGDTGLITLSNGLVNITGELQVSTLDIGGTNVTALASDINKLTGLTTTTSELEYVHGVTSSIQTQLNYSYLFQLTTVLRL